jgi:ATP-dependent Zn protease
MTTTERTQHQPASRLAGRTGRAPRARSLLETNRANLDALAAELVEHEVVDRSQLIEIATTVGAQHASRAA